ncbi:hypothetical protein HOC13_04875 [Candidatus Woesearchaeota archaeon]|nr:hypothetical protein [Candidatus Woesearchaeota archaeon]
MDLMNFFEKLSPVVLGVAVFILVIWFIKKSLKWLLIGLVMLVIAIFLLLKFWLGWI